MTSPYGIAALVVVATSFTHSAVRADSAEDQLRDKMDTATSEYNDAIAAASEGLLGAFDKQIAVISKNSSLNSNDREAVIEAVENEKGDFERHGTLPFSPAMRDSAVRYLNSIASARKKAGKPFEKAISHYRTKRKDNDTAGQIADEKEKLLGAKLLGTWTFTHKEFGTYAVPLYSDGTAGPNKSWTLDEAGIVIRHRTQAAPQGCWIDKGIIEYSGKTCEIKNQAGHVKKGSLANPDE